MFFLLVLSALVLLIAFLVEQIRKPSNYPPGPRWYPFVGSLPELRKLSKKLGGSHLVHLELAKQYRTNVVGLKLGGENVIVVHSYPLLKLVHSSEVFEGRPDNFFIHLRCLGNRSGITCTDGPTWSTLRQFVVKQLRQLGLGKQYMYELVHDEVENIHQMLRIRKNCNNVNKIIGPAVLNILWRLVAGGKITDRIKIDNLLDLFEKRSKLFDVSGGVLAQYPWLCSLFPERTGLNLIRRINKDLKGLLMDVINEHYDTWRDGRQDDLIHAFITEIKRTEENEANKSLIFNNEQLITVCLDLFIGGAQTTGNTLGFAFLLMILYPEIQEKVEICIRNEFKPEESIKYSERHRIPYVEAVLFEVLRFYHVVPITGPRRVLKDTVLDGYSIPKNTTVLLGLCSVHNDEEIWDKSKEFRPERFLDKDGCLLNPEQLIPFGLGKRRCLGDSLAKHCIFIFFAETVRRFQIKLKPGSKLPSGKPLPGITLSPDTYEALFEERK